MKFKEAYNSILKTPITQKASPAPKLKEAERQNNVPLK